MISERLDGVQFPLRQKIRSHFVQLEFLSYEVGGLLVVPGEKNHVMDSRGMEFINGRPALGADRIRNREEPEHSPGVGEDYHRLAHAFKREEFFLHDRRTDPEFLHEQVISHDIGCPVDSCADSLTRDRGKIFCDEIGECNAGFLCFA